MLDNVPLIAMVPPHKIKTIDKKPMLLAVDPSLTCSGWACFCLDTQTLCAVGEVKALGPEFSMGYRLKTFQEEIRRLYEKLQLNENDIIICEAPTTMRDPHAAILVEQVRCIFECLGRSRGCFVPGRINPRTVHKVLLGSGGMRQQPRDVIKAQALSVAKMLYPEALMKFGLMGVINKHQDIVDAILIGNVALSWVGQSRATKTNLELFFEKRKRSSSRVKRNYAA